jgi:asparagine synthase (glutamine-hydrolysing)
MPGIFGIIEMGSRSVAGRSEELAEIAQQMSAAMAYEPFYSSVIVSCPAVGACVGRVTLDEPPGHATAAESDPIVMAAGEGQFDARYRDKPEDAIVRRIGSRCAAFVANLRDSRILLFNDRFGRERLFVYTEGPRTFFSSEAKAILAVAPGARAFDSKGLAELLACGCTLGSRSLFRGIEALEPGTLITFDRSGVRRRRFLTPEQLEGRDQVPAAQFLEGFKESLRAAVEEAVSRLPKVAISLTGGLDSRMIMASLDAPAGSVPCYTFGSMYRITGDVAVAQEVAARCGQPHRVLEVGPDFLANVDDHVERAVYISDGYLGLSGAAELHANRQARAIAPARITGNWGGELMRGVRAFKFVVPKGDFVSAGLRQAIGESAAEFSKPFSNSLTAALFNQVPLQGYCRYAIERSQVVTRTPFLAEDVVEWLYRAPTVVRAAPESAAAVIGRRPALLSIPTDIGALGARPSAFRRAWRRGLVKAEYMTSHGAPDWLARVAAALPATLLETRFLGVDKFQHFRFWMRRDLAGFVRETLLGRDSTNLGEWFDMRRVAEMVDEHVDGRANYTSELDKVLTVALAQRRLFRDRPAAGIRVNEAMECIR